MRGSCPLLVFFKYFFHLLGGEASTLLDAFARSLEQRNKLGALYSSGRSHNRHTGQGQARPPSMRLTYSASGSVASCSSIVFIAPCARLLDDLVGLEEDGWGDGEANGLGGLEVDD